MHYEDSIPKPQADPPPQEGGLTRWSASAPVAPASFATAPALRVGRGAISMNTFDGVVHERGGATYNTNPAGTAGASIMSTLQTGSRPSVCLVPGDEATRTDCVTAARMGAIKVTDSGRYEDIVTLQGEPAVAQAAQETDVAPVTEPAVDKEDSDAWQAHIDPVPQHAFDAATASVIGRFTTGDADFKQTVINFAESAGMDPEQAHGTISEGVALHARIVDRAVATLGLTGDAKEAFYDHLRADPRKMQDALQRLAYGQDASGFRELATQYLAGRK